jgi:hypothetical protein
MPRTINRGVVLGSAPATVQYTHTTGKTYDAVVTGPGAGANELNLRVRALNGTAGRDLTNVPRRTTARGGAGYLGRWSL